MFRIIIFKLRNHDDAAGKEQRFAYNPRGQQLAIWGDSAQPISYTYTESGQLASRT
jgi:hypothetical protein